MNMGDFIHMKKAIKRVSKLAAGNPITGDTSPVLPEKNPAAVALGRLGGLKGGKARALALSSTKRKEIARKAAMTRWGKSSTSE
jgi:hypothetical protein